MICFKRKLFFFLVMFAGLSNTEFMLASDEDDSGDLFFCDDLWDDFDDNAQPNISRNVTNTDTLTIYADTIKLNNIIATNLYLKTNPINSRPLNSTPAFSMYHTDKLNEDFIFNTYVLYNQNLKQFFSPTSAAIGSYISLNTDDVIEKLDSQITEITLPPILELFQTGKIQERKVGFMFQMLKNHNRWSFEANVPLVYQERNFFFTEGEQAQIQQQVSQITGDSSAEVNEKYLRKHAMSDEIGFGNIKLKTGYRFISDKHLKMKVGVIAIIPSAFALNKGLLGSNFRKSLEKPDLDLNQVYCWVQDHSNPSNITSFKEFGVDFLEKSAKRLGAILLDQPLGNRHHFELGLFWDSKFIVNQNVSCKINAEFQYSLPKTELRFFNQLKNASDFTTSALKDDVDALSGTAQEDLATTKVEFLNKNAVTSMFPTPANTRISPQANYQLSVGPQFEVGGYLLHFGYNVWHRSQERIGKTEALETLLYPLDTANGIRAAATQHKIFIQFDYDRVTPKHIWKVSLRGDETLDSAGIGKDTNLALELSVDF